MQTDENGHLVVTTMFKDEDLCERIKSIARDVYKKPINQEMPAIMIKSQGDVMPVHWENFREDMAKIEWGQIAQQYIYPFGGKACCVRFIYYNPACNLEGHINYSMNVANKLKIDEGVENFSPDSNMIIPERRR